MLLICNIHQSGDPIRGVVHRIKCAIMRKFGPRRREPRLVPNEGPRMRLKDNVAIITGAGQGIGQATAVKFAKEGAKVVACDINKASVDNTVRLITEGGGTAIGYIIDVTKKESLA